MANVFPIREAAVIFEEIGGCLFLKWKQIIAESINMNKSRASLKSVCDRHYFGSFCLRTDTVGHKEKIIKTLA